MVVALAGFDDVLLPRLARGRHHVIPREVAARDAFGKVRDLLVGPSHLLQEILVEVQGAGLGVLRNPPRFALQPHRVPQRRDDVAELWVPGDHVVQRGNEAGCRPGWDQERLHLDDVGRVRALERQQCPAKVRVPGRRVEETLDLDLVVCAFSPEVVVQALGRGQQVVEPRDGRVVRTDRPCLDHDRALLRLDRGQHEREQGDHQGGDHQPVPHGLSPPGYLRTEGVSRRSGRLLQALCEARDKRGRAEVQPAEVLSCPTFLSIVAGVPSPLTNSSDKNGSRAPCKTRSGRDAPATRTCSPGIAAAARRRRRAFSQKP